MQRVYEDCETIFDFLRKFIFRENEFFPLDVRCISSFTTGTQFRKKKSPKVMHAKVRIIKRLCVVLLAGNRRDNAVISVLVFALLKLDLCSYAICRLAGK